MTRIVPRSLQLLAILLIAVALAVPAISIVAQPAGWECQEPATSPADAAWETSGTAPFEPVPFPATGGGLTVFAAASLTDAFAQMEPALEATNPQLDASFNFAGSQALLAQLKEGAHADVLAAADVESMQAAVEAGLIAGDPLTFTKNRLAIVTPASNPAGIENPSGLGKDGLRLILARPDVPAGRYARQAVCRMAAEAGTYGEDFSARVAANLVSEEEDVRGVLAKVALGEADAGIVYVTDAAAAGDQVQTVAIPDDMNVVATYPVAALADGDESLARAFISYLLSEDGQATLAASGFAPLAES